MKTISTKGVGRKMKEGEGKKEPLLPKQVKHYYLLLITGHSIFIFLIHISYFPQNSISIPSSIQQTRNRNFLNLIEGIYENATANVRLNSGRLNTSPKIRSKKRIFALDTPFPQYTGGFIQGN